MRSRRQAQLAIGGCEQVKERCRDARGTRWLEELLQDFRYAARLLRQKPGFAVAPGTISNSEVFTWRVVVSDFGDR